MQEAPVLRPLSVGDIVDRVLRLFRANAILLLAVALFPSLIMEILQRATGLSQTFDLNDFSAAFASGTAGRPVTRQFQPVDPVAATAVGIIGVVLYLVQFGALVHAVGQRYLGRPESIREAYVQGLRAAPRLFLNGLIAVVLFVAVFLVLFLGVALLNVQAFTAIAIVIGLVAFVVLLPYALVSLAVVGPAIVLEGLGPIAAIRRSFHLMKKARWRAVGLYVLMAIISSLLGVIFGLVFLVSFVSEPTARTVLQTLASVASAAVSSPLLYGAIVVLYYDLRVRKEAFDLQLAAEALPREG